MKNINSLLKTVFTAMLCFAVFAGTMMVIRADKVFAADDEYTYTITVNAGKEGDFSDGKTVKLGPYHYGDSCTVNINSLGLKISDPDTYYARGLKISGHDNDEVSRRDFQSYTFDVTGDESFSVAYALKGNMVEYVVNYVDEDGNELHQSETFYGMIGDYPVVSYQVVDGYLPDAYNKGKTLSSDESENVFTFVYSRNEGGGTNTIIVDNRNGGAGNAGTGAGNAGAGTGNGPAQFVNLDDGATPTTDPGSVGGNGDNGDNGGNNGGGTSKIDDQDTPTSLIDRVGLMPFVLGGGLLAALVALIAFLRARGDDGDEEDADELEDTYINDPEGINKLENADPEQFKTDDPDKLKEAFKELGKKE